MLLLVFEKNDGHPPSSSRSSNYYCNGVLIGLPANLIRRLQSVQNAAARLIFGIRRSEHITDALASLHWRRVPERILFKVAVLTYRALNGSAPTYLLHPRRRRSISIETTIIRV